MRARLTYFVAGRGVAVALDFALVASAKPLALSVWDRQKRLAKAERYSTA